MGLPATAPSEARRLLVTFGPVELWALSSLQDRTARWVATEEDASLAGDGQTLLALLELSPTRVHAERGRLRRACDENKLRLPLGYTLLTRGPREDDVLVYAVAREAGRGARGHLLGELYGRLLDHCALHGIEALALHGIGLDLAQATPEEVAVQLTSALVEHLQAPTSMRRLELAAPPGDQGERLVNRLVSELARARPGDVGTPRLDALLTRLPAPWTPPAKTTATDVVFTQAESLLEAMRSVIGSFVLELRSRRPNTRLGPGLDDLLLYLPHDGQVRRFIDELEEVQEFARQLRERCDRVDLRRLWRRCVALAAHPLFAQPAGEGDHLPGVLLLEEELGLGTASTEATGEQDPLLATIEHDGWPAVLLLARQLLAREATRRHLELGTDGADAGSLLEQLVRRLATASPRAVLDDLSTWDLLELAQIPAPGDRDTATRTLLGRFRYLTPEATGAEIEGLNAFRQRLDECATQLNLRSDRSTLVGSMIDAGSTLERIVRRLLQFHCQARLGLSTDRFVQEYDEDAAVSNGGPRASLGSLLRWLQRLDDVLRLPDTNRPPDRTGFTRPLLPFSNAQQLAELRNRFGHDRTDLGVQGSRGDADEFFRMTMRWLNHLAFDTRPLFPRVVVVRGVEVDEYGRRRYRCVTDARTEAHLIAHQRLELGAQYFVHPLVRPYDAPVIVYPLVVGVDRGREAPGVDPS